MGFPSSRTSPFSGCKRPETVRKVVDFPAPLAPSRQTISFSRTRGEIREVP